MRGGVDMLILEWYHVLALFVMFCIFFFACAVAFTVYQS